MQIKKSESTNTSFHENLPGRFRIGQNVKVEIIKKINDTYLIKINQRNFIANLKGQFPESRFIGRILKLNPQIIVKYIRGINSYDKNVFKVNGYLELKKSIIRNLFETDNLFVSISKKELIDRYDLKAKLKEAIYKTSIQSIFKLRDIENINEKLFGFIILERVHSFLNEGAIQILFPLRVNKHKSLIHGTVYRDEGDNFSIFIVVHFDNEDNKIGVLIRIDFSSICCTIFTDNISLYRKLHREKKCLENSLRSVKYSRIINIDIRNSYTEIDNILGNIKKIDLKM